jgi:hypothetical protein
MSRAIRRALALLAVAILGLAVGGQAPAFAAGTHSVTRAPLNASGSTTGLGRGARITVSGGGYAPGAPVVITDQSGGAALGRIKADPTGWVTANVALDLPAGRHTVVATGAAAAGGMLELSLGVSIGRSSGNLAHAGTDSAGMIALIVAMLAAGAALIGTGRRRRSAREAV